MQYEFTSKYRTWRLSVTEEPDVVILALSCSKYGNFDDLPQFHAWANSIIGKYDKDSRPLQLTNQHTGERCTVWGDENSYVAAIESRKDIN